MQLFINSAPQIREEVSPARYQAHTRIPSQWILLSSLTLSHDILHSLGITGVDQRNSVYRCAATSRVQGILLHVYCPFTFFFETLHAVPHLLVFCAHLVLQRPAFTKNSANPRSKIGSTLPWTREIKSQPPFAQNTRVWRAGKTLLPPQISQRINKNRNWLTATSFLLKNLRDVH